MSRKMKHGLARKGKLDKHYKILRGIIRRCYSESCTGYSYYGGRGIRVCDEWRESPLAFKAWSIKAGYKEGLQIDRIDNDGDYSPENCRFVTAQENVRNQRLIKSDNTSGFRGVYYNKVNRKWMAYYSVDKKVTNLGYYESAELAGKARDSYILEKKIGLPLNFKESELVGFSYNKRTTLSGVAKHRNKWCSYIGINGKKENLGLYIQRWDAICARMSANNKYGRVNFER